ncbi:Phospholipid methyltransferase [Mariprofundus ferrinatatus]|uniref:Phospholipid methyltransferase n=1 Tax=Mariprofundus ferrinatatus TaxID=1921087 RepID=A0A2K8L430_9PROT|nr:isoprenylcysteine carboxylmethyltransferase family protein [Mariprofundus ferrinatatus]ATX82047.1 Phospholipid methyltransferase [Mariprofundus ferrinatatus]
MSTEIANKSAWHRLVIEHRIKLTYAFAILALIFIRPSLEAMIWGLPFVVGGELIRIWASGHIHKFKEVTRTGPYALCRHPLYLGHFLILIGFMIAGNQIWVAISGIVIFWLIFIPTMQREETQLTEMFGDEYRRYMQTTPRVIPRWNAKGRNAGSFNPALVAQHRELNNIIGLAAALLIFATLGLLHASW